MYPDLARKRVVVTGAAQGIGRAIVRAFVEADANVIAVVRRVPEEPVTDRSGQVLWLTCDIRQPAPLTRYIADLEATGGQINVLVNNAGVLHKSPLIDATPAEVSETFDTNVAATLVLSQIVARHMSERGGGSIIHAASYAAILPSVAHGVYAASKAALLSLTRSMAAEWAPWGIRVNAFSPGVIPTNMTRPALEASGPSMLDAISLRRLGEPSEVASAVLFLASDVSSYVTGVNLEVTGGKFAVQNPNAAWA